MSSAWDSAHLDAFQAHNGVKQRQQQANRFPRKCETSFVGDAFIHSLLTMRSLFTIPSLLTMHAIHDFPLKFDYLLTIFPCLILHSSKCNFTCHTHRPKADGFGVLKIVWSTDTIYWIDSNDDCPCLMLLVASDLTQCVSFALTFPGTQLCALSFVKSNIEHRNSRRGTVKL